MKTKNKINSDGFAKIPPPVKVVISGYINAEKVLPNDEATKLLKAIYKQKMDLIKALPEDKLERVLAHFSQTGLPLKNWQWLKAPIDSDQFKLNISIEPVIN